MFRRLQTIQSPINLTRKGHRVHVGPDINIYSADGSSSTVGGGNSLPGMYQLTATPYGTYSLSDSENLLHPDNILNSSGIATVGETEIANTGEYVSDPQTNYRFNSPLQVGISWYSAELQPDHLYSHYVLTIERKTFNQGKNVDISVTQNVVQGPSTITSNIPVTASNGAADEWQPFEIRDGNEPYWSYADNQDQKYIQNFSNVDLIDQGFLYYCVLRYPDWDGSNHGTYGLNAFQKIFRSFIWITNDGIIEDDEDFYVRLRAIKKDINFAPEGEPGEINIFHEYSSAIYEEYYGYGDDVSQYPDFITDQDQVTLSESVIVSETIMRIRGTSSGAEVTTGIHTLYNSEYSGVIGLPPSIDADYYSEGGLVGNRRQNPYGTLDLVYEDLFEGRPGSSGWDYPQMIWSPLISDSYDDQYFVDDPDGNVIANNENYFGMTTETAGLNSPIGPFCGYYTAMTFISIYTAQELRTCGMTTGSVLQGITYDVVQAASKIGDTNNEAKPVMPFLSIVNVLPDIVGSSPAFTILNKDTELKAHNEYFSRINGLEAIPLGMNAFSPYDIDQSSAPRFRKFDTVGPQRFSVGGGSVRSKKDKYIWNGRDAIAIIASYNYQDGYRGSSTAFGPSNYRIGGDDDGGDLKPALVRMAKTYINRNNVGQGSRAYVFPDNTYTSGDQNFFSASARDKFGLNWGGLGEYPSFTAPSYGNGIYQAKRYFKYDSSTINHNSASTQYGAKSSSNYLISARPVIQLDWVNANPSSVIEFNLGFYNDPNPAVSVPSANETNWTHGVTISVWLQPDYNTSTSDLIGPLPMTYVNFYGNTVTGTSITDVGQTWDNYGDSSYPRFNRSDVTVDLSSYMGTGPVRVLIRALYLRANQDNQTVVTRPVRIKDLSLIAPLDFVNRSWYYPDTDYWTNNIFDSTYRETYMTDDDDVTDHDTFNKFYLHRTQPYYPQAFPGETLQEFSVIRTLGAFDPSPTGTNYDCPLGTMQTYNTGGSQWYQRKWGSSGHLELGPVTTYNGSGSSTYYYGDWLLHKETFVI